MREAAWLYFRFQSNPMVYALTQYDTVNHDPMPNSEERAFENNKKTLKWNQRNAIAMDATSKYGRKIN